jgi:hypothetical protein
MNVYLFLFYATTVNIPMGPYMPQNYSHGAYNLWCSKATYIYFFSNAMLMQKSKHAKRRMIMHLLESNYVKRETDAILKKDKYG